MDPAGNLYGTTYCDGANRLGNVFKLTPSGGGWMYTSLHDFTGGNDGEIPFCSVAFDSSGKLYGTAVTGGCAGRWDGLGDYAVAGGFGRAVFLWHAPERPRESELIAEDMPPAEAGSGIFQSLPRTPLRCVLGYHDAALRALTFVNVALTGSKRLSLIRLTGDER